MAGWAVHCRVQVDFEGGPMLSHVLDESEKSLEGDVTNFEALSCSAVVRHLEVAPELIHCQFKASPFFYHGSKKALHEKDTFYNSDLKEYD